MACALHDARRTNMRKIPTYNFSVAFTTWPLHNQEHLNLTLIESSGDSLDALLTNACITLEDWHGNEGPAWDLRDLAQTDYDAVVALFTELMHEADMADADMGYPV